jgi:Zn-dependent M28 family amino/carboxypeptidase
MNLGNLQARLQQHVTTLAQKPRVPLSPEHRRAAEYIRTHLQQAGFIVEEDRFSEAGFTGLNLLTRPLPDRPELPLVIVGAHYDSVPGSPGADDNASAVAALLELAVSIHPYLDQPLAHRLQLAAYDLEEFGFVGSFLHCRALARDGSDVRGMISLEMLGYTDHQPGSQRLPPQLVGLYPSVGHFIGVCGNEASRGMVQTVTEAMQTIEGLPVEFIAVPGRGESLPLIRLSDHSSFWDHGHPALMITDTSFLRNPHYHQASDTPETLDYPFLARVTAGVTEAVRRLLGPAVTAR